MLNPKLITIFLLLFVSLLLGYFIALPEFRRGSEKKQEFLRAQSDLAITKGDLTHTRELIDFYKKLSSDNKSRLIQALPVEVDLPNLLVQVDRMARESGVLLEDFSIKEEGLAITGFEAESAESGTGSSLMTMKIAGGYSAVKEFMKNLEGFLRIIDVASILLTPSEEKSSTSTLQVIITARVYKAGDKIQALTQ